MTAREVVGTIEFPVGSGSPCVGARISATLYTGIDGNPAYGTDSGDRLVGSTADLSDNSGAWSLDLEPNATITPAGTVWQITEEPPDRATSTYWISVPDTAGPHDVTDLLAEQPGALPSQALAEHAALSAAHGATGAIVGTTNSQTLTNKTLTSPIIATGLTMADAAAAAAARVALSAQRSNRADIRDHGAVDGQNATSAIADALAAVGAGGVVHVPDGTWLITVGDGAGVGGVLLNTAAQHLELAPGAVLQAVASDRTAYHLIWISAADCIVSGGSVVGDVGSHIGSTGEHGHGIRIAAGADRAMVYGTKVSLCWGDGVYVNGADLLDVSLIQVTADDNRRNGFSIIRAVRPLVTLCRSINIGATAYTAPGAGYDWEPNATESLVGGQMIGCWSAGCQGPGLAIGGAGVTAQVSVTGYSSVGDCLLGLAAPGSAAVYLQANADVKMSNAIIDGGYYGINISFQAARTSLSSTTSVNATLYGFLVDGGASRLVNCGVLDSGGSGFLADASSTLVLLNGCEASGTNHATSGPAFDIAGPGGVLSGCVVSSVGALCTYGYRLRAAATDSIMANCVSLAAGTSGHLLDSSTASWVFPVPGGTKPTGVAVTAEGIHAALVSLGLISA